MKPSDSCERKGLFREAIDRDFGSLANFKSKFAEAGAKLFGSGWVWLTRTQQNDGKIEIICTNGHGHPMMQNRFPLLLNDVWEHTYYLQYESRRADYLKVWWSIADWDQANRCFERSDSTLEELLEIEDELFPPYQKSIICN